MFKFFYGSRNGTLSKFDNIFSGPEPDGEGDDDRGNRGSTSIASHYGWLYILRNLDTTKILDITGDTNILKSNIIFILNWLSMETEIAKEKERQERQMRLANKSRYN